ncbi:hypothetical protein D6C90_09886 [Aureobasidium pullulans]|uniref:Ima1 N-terminal domain-containing protein n=1 Tax=Aureobasidium pullulans TaxID=5580 RepID=A0A4S9EMR5_AURPU|nr:hypothetical protein D6D12_00089 [Aureobasidium pullulans]THX46731.1 hypothetical protein D6D11_06730 [Aureobasidium pullulans]THZ17492.1 hypothetical protein D6C90_09886 [Aureobasidium pullulans]
MPSLLAPRLSCFYCGSRSPHVKDGRTRQFTCTVCDATNHLDSKGEITDPPATSNLNQNTSFAHPPPRPTSPIQSESTEHFCKTCLKNQQIVANLLAEYLPADDDPQYNKFVAEYPQYRKNLERRYPQVCPRCAPKVQQQLKKTVYGARADFLSRKIEQSKSQFVNNLSTPASLGISALNVVALAWWGSALFQAYWHTLAFLGIPGDSEEVAGLTPLMVVGCSVNGFRLHMLPAGCAYLFVDLVKKSLYVSFWLVWWNPTFKDRLRFPYRTHHALGLADFYRYQFVILAIRATAWFYLSGPWIEGSASDLNKGMHGCAILFIVLSTVASLRTIVYSTGPRVSWKTSNEPLIEPGSFHPPTDDFTSQASPHLPTMSPSRQPFPLENLGTRSATRSATRAASPLMSRFGPPSPSPAPSQDMGDSMDWEPISQPSPIRPSHAAQSNAASAIPAFLRPAASMATGEKSPFTGRLPPAPMSPAHRLRNPPAPPQFKPTPLSQQRDFFKKMGLSNNIPSLSKKSAMTEDHDDEDSPRKPAAYMSSLDRNRTKDHFELHPPKWTLQSDMEAATKGTGLEDMFTSSFNIADEHDPMTPRSARRTAARASANNTPNGYESRGIFDRAPVEPIMPETTAEIVKRNAREMALPVGLAVGAAFFAWARDPGAREWMGW